MVCMYWVYVCDIGMDNAYRLISDLGDNRLVGMCLDVKDKEGTKELLKKVDICINAISTFA